MNRTLSYVLPLAMTAVALSGCTADSQGTIGLAVSDAPVDDWNKIEVTFSKGAIHRSESADPNATSGWITIVNTTRTVDLLALHRNNTAAALGFAEVGAGKYQQFRLFVDKVEGTDKNGTKVAMTVPSGVIKIKTHFEVKGGDNQTIELEIDLNKSVNCNKQGCKFSPSIRATKIHKNG